MKLKSCKYDLLTVIYHSRNLYISLHVVFNCDFFLGKERTEVKQTVRDEKTGGKKQK